MTPVISAVQPAFVWTESKPYLEIEANNIIEGAYYKLKIMNSYTAKIKLNLISNNYTDNKIKFNLTEDIDKLDIGQYYKVALIALDSSQKEILPWSNIGVIKYIKEPEFNITFFNPEFYEDFWVQVGQTEEQLKNSEAIAEIQVQVLTNSGETLLESDIIFSNNNGVFNYSPQIKICPKNDNSIIKVIINFTTASGYKSQKSEIISVKKITTQTINSIIFNQNIETAQNILSYPSSIGNVNFYKKINLNIANNFELFAKLSQGTDGNIRPCEKYDYLLENNVNNFQRFLGEELNFEHTYLFDNTINFCIKFNPKVSSFKDTRLEQKVETIGSQYPFFQRNGSVAYKEFQISGLISRLAETIENDKKYREFTPSENTTLPNGFSTDLTANNIELERQYKIKILDWLNNGKPKVFKSPTEGNFIVRLSNISLTPEEKLGRMLHNFSCTATEIAEYNYENLLKYNLA